jgi:hypothetical protein
MPVYQPLPNKTVTVCPSTPGPEDAAKNIIATNAMFKAKEAWLKLKAQVHAYISPPECTTKSRYQVKELMKITKMIHTGWRKIMSDTMKNPFAKRQIPYLSTKTATIMYTKTSNLPIPKSISLIDFREFHEYEEWHDEFMLYTRGQSGVTRNPLFKTTWTNSYNCLSSLGKKPRLRRRIRKNDNGEGEL